MMTFPRLIAFLVISPLLCLAAPMPPDCAAAPGSASNPRSESNEDTIFLQDSGSTNAAGFCYIVTRAGNVTKKTGATILQRRQGRPNPSEQSGSIPVSLAKKLFADVEAAMPLSKLPVIHCPKSVSFGTSRFISFKGEKSSDVSCARGNEKIAALKTDFAEVASAADHQP
jgi:hypothetical protein